MRAYDIALFLALLGAVSGALDYVMMDAGGTNWFESYTTPDMQMISVSEDMVGNLNESSSQSYIPSSVEGVLFGVYFLLSMFKGMLLFSSVLANVFYYADPANPTSNLFLPVLVIIQVGIWIVYIIGILQYKSGRNLREME